MAREVLVVEPPADILLVEKPLTEIWESLRFEDEYLL